MSIAIEGATIAHPMLGFEIFAICGERFELTHALTVCPKL
jgi:hypothetical protein